MAAHLVFSMACPFSLGVHTQQSHACPKGDIRAVTTATQSLATSFPALPLSQDSNVVLACAAVLGVWGPEPFKELQASRDSSFEQPFPKDPAIAQA